MADIYNMAGSSIWIGGVIDVPLESELTLASFTGQAWKKIGGWQTAGSLGDTAQVTTVALIGGARDRKLKGSRNGGAMENTFVPDETDLGQIALLAAAENCVNYAFRLIYSAGCQRSSVVTMTIAVPGVISWPLHGLANGALVRLATTGALPTGLTAGTDYYVVGSAAGTFQLALTPGGAPITTTGTQSGVHTATAVPAGRTRMFGGLVMTNQDQGGDANAAQMFNSTVEINSNIVRL